MKLILKIGFPYLLGAMFLLSNKALFAQGIVQNGGFLVQTPGSNIIVSGSNGNYKSVGKSTIKMSPNSFFVVTNHWINNGNSPIFSNNDGRVELRGSNIQIDGNTTTHFPDLNLSGNGKVGLFVNTLVGGGFKGGGLGVLRLNSSKLELNSRRLIINNKTSGAIT